LKSSSYKVSKIIPTIVMDGEVPVEFDNKYEVETFSNHYFNS